MKFKGTQLASGVLTSLPGRYAKALFDLAQEQGQVDSIGEKLQSLENLTRSLPILRQALRNPTLQREGQVAALVEICARVEAPAILQSFIGQLAKAQRLSYLSRIETLYRRLAADAKGEQTIEVVSAWPLTPAQTNVLETKLKEVFPGEIALSFINDPKVLGGIMLRVGSRVIDATLTTQLNQLATIMKGTA